MASFMTGREILKLAIRHGWVDRGGSKHPVRMVKPGKRTVPIRDRLENADEVRAVLKQLEIPRADWPEKLK